MVGKTLRTDLAKGKLTLPILNLIGAATESQRSKLNKLLIQNEPVDLSVLAGIADYEGAIERAVQEAKDMLVEARENLIGLPGADYAAGLGQATLYLDSLLESCIS